MELHSSQVVTQGSSYMGIQSRRKAFFKGEILRLFLAALQLKVLPQG